MRKSIRFAILGSALLGTSAATAGQASQPLRPPPGYFAPVSLGKGHASKCDSPPTPYTAELNFPSKYEGSGAARDELNGSADESYQRSTQAITAMEKGLSGMIRKYMSSGDPAQLRCAVDWLTAWADAGALRGKATTHTGRSMRKWSLASISGAYLHLKFSTTNPLAEYPLQAARIQTWLAAVADLVAREWPADTPLAKFNNHYYWAAWSLMATAVATNRRDLFDDAVTLYRVFARQVDSQGYLPNELARASRAAEYHRYAMLPLAMIAAFAKANDLDLTAEGDHALARFGARVLVAMDDPASFESQAGEPQQLRQPAPAEWAWLPPYCWAVGCGASLQARLAQMQPLIVTRLGGSVSAAFSAAPGP